MIFNKNNSGSDEIHSVVGQYFKANKFEVIESEIISAEDTIRQEIGEKLFERVSKYYNSAAASTGGDSQDDKLLQLMQSSVATLAIYRFFQQNLVGHEDAGRKIAINKENESMPWQWQVDRDDEAMLDKYYRTLDALYKFLDKEKIAEWTGSPLKKRLEQCFVKSVDQFQQVYPIENSFRMFYILVPFMVECQERVIRPVVGDEAYKKMVAGETDDIQNMYEATQRVIPLYAIITAVKRMSIKVLPTMIVRRFTSSFQGGKAGNIDDKATQSLLQTLSAEAMDAKEELQKIVTQNFNPAKDAKLLPDNDPNNNFFQT